MAERNRFLSAYLFSLISLCLLKKMCLTVLKEWVPDSLDWAKIYPL